jgi:hypothetical protein
MWKKTFFLNESCFLGYLIALEFGMAIWYWELIVLFFWLFNSQITWGYICESGEGGIGKIWDEGSL